MGRLKVSCKDKKMFTNGASYKNVFMQLLDIKAEEVGL